MSDQSRVNDSNPSGGIPEEGDLRSVRQGAKPGDRYVRIVKGDDIAIRRKDSQTYVAGEHAPSSGPARIWHKIQRVAIGRPIESSLSSHQRLSKRKALAVFSSDALSSTAYATEEILLVLALAGAVGFVYLMPIALAIVILLAIVVFSYRQTIFAYPSGGGAYSVTRENLGQTPSLVAASALLTDYILTVAVSISAGTAAVTSAFPEVRPYAVEMGVGAIILITLINLRGVRESGTIFAIPTYAFIIGMAALVAIGLVSWMTGDSGISAETSAPLEPTESITLLLLFRAFSSGCAALTGVEAISNGVPAFEEPTSRNAARTLVIMALILGTLFLGISLLADHFHLVPNEDETIISQLARAVVGESLFYYGIQAATASILFLAANTSFADFPRVTSVLALDRFLPHQFAFRGDRLVYTSGIVVLSALSCVLVVGFGANVSALIGLYAVGVFISFTLSQYGMVRRWKRQPDSRHRTIGMAVSTAGAVTTGLVAIIIIETKFVQGAWAVLILIPVLMFLMSRVHRHYLSVADQLRMPASVIRARRQAYVRGGAALVPVASLNRSAVIAIEYARAQFDDVTAIHVTDTLESIEDLRQKWELANMQVPLIVIESPFRELIAPIVQFTEQFHDEKGGLNVTVIVPEFVPHSIWHLLLHNQTAWRLRFAFWKHPGIVVTSVPYHLRE